MLGKRYEAEKRKQAGAPAGNQNAQKQCAQSGHITGPNRTAKRIAAELDIGANTVRRAADFARAVDTLAADQARSRIKGMCSTPTPSLC